VKLLLDESLPQDLRFELPGHEVVTVPFRGWASKQNGELLGLAAAEFDALLTADHRIETQQNVARFDIAVVILVARSNRLADLIQVMPAVLEALPQVRPGRVYRVGSR